MKPNFILLGLAVLGLALALGACGQPAASPEIVKETVIVEVPVTPEPREAELEVPFLELWASSGHADDSAEAFTHWDEDDPKVVPASCARCHTTSGYQDYIGADGTAANATDGDHDTGQVITCEACHNDVTLTMDSVVMPSGIELTDLGREARCMQCHQGRESTISVNAFIEEVGAGEDEPSEDLRFRNIHYYPAAATKFGTEAKGGYEYEGKSYDAFFVHVEGYEDCQECHNPHTLEIKVDECKACHTNVETVEDLKDNRMPGSMVDYDGDGDITEGVYYEMEGLRAKLYSAILAYAEEIAAVAIVYDSHSYPYFFIDTNADGEVSEDEANYGNQYNLWTPRLLKAAYNYQVSLTDPGAFAHGGKYIIQLMWDSIEDLNTVISAPVVLQDAHAIHEHRIDHGHFAGSEEAFRHWDEDDPAVIPASCSRCHSAAGLPLYLSEGVTIAQEPANGFLCSTCHNDLSTFTRYEAASVTFPSGETLDSGDPNMNLCMTCHQGRESAASVDRAVAGLPDDTVSDSIRFINIHYFPAGATRFGTEAKGGYEYAGKTYQGFFPHVEAYDSCTECHSAHQLQVKYEECSMCHATVTEYDDLRTIRMSTVDFDGDDDAAEGLFGEIETIAEALLVAMQAYATANADAAAIIYDSHSYPYYFIDTDEDGVSAGPSEANYGNRYASWTPALLRAAYNYQYSQKDPGAYAHNGKYLLQLLYDSLQDMGGSVSGMTRP